VDKTLEVVFEKEKLTSGTVRCKEVVDDDDMPSIGTLYVRKTALATLGIRPSNVGRVRVVITFEEV